MITWTRNDLAAVFNCNPETIARWQRGGLIPCQGRPIRYTAECIVDYILSHYSRDDAGKYLSSLLIATGQALENASDSSPSGDLEWTPVLKIGYDPQRPIDAERAMSAEQKWEMTLSLQQDRAIKEGKYILRETAEKLVTEILQTALDHYLPASPSDEDKAKWDSLAVKIQSLVAEVTGGTSS